GGEEALLRSSQRANAADLIQVRRDEPPANQLARTRRDLSRTDEETVATSPALPSVKTASEASRETRALWNGKKKRARLVGAGTGALDLYHLEIQKGRYLTADDLAQRHKVCVIGQEIWRELLEERPSIDDVELTADGQVWT